jgi:periplasmic protein TonB
MTALPWWFEGDYPRDLLRWSTAGAAVVCIHAALVGGYLLWHQPDQEIGDDSSIVSVELAPIDSVADANQRDVAPAPEDMIEQRAVPKAEKEPDQPKIDEPPPPPAVTMPDVALPEQKPPEKVEEERPPIPRTTARAQGGAPRIEATWQTVLLKHLQQYKRYPQSAQTQGEQGVVLLGFSVDRNGRVIKHHIVQSSGHTDLDNEVMAMIERAQPLPAFPASMTQPILDLTVPIRFSLH